ncbi:MAG: hypothetical protein ACK44Y_07430, partial [Novosphingobium sp.]
RIVRPGLYQGLGPQIRMEISWSLASAAIYGVPAGLVAWGWQQHGWTLVYTDFAAYPLWYLPLPSRKPAEAEQDARRDERDARGRGGQPRGGQGRGRNNNRSPGGQSRDGQSRDQYHRNEHVRKEWAPREQRGPVFNPLAAEEREARQFGVMPKAGAKTGDRRPAPTGDRRPVRQGERRDGPQGERRGAPHGDRRPGGDRREGGRGGQGQFRGKSHNAR